MNQLASSTWLLSAVAIFFASYAEYLVIGSLIILSLFKPAWRKISVLALLSGLIARYGVKSFILLIYTRNRPYDFDQPITQLITQTADQVWKSFPSGHTIFFFALATTIYLYDKKYGKYFLLVAFLISIARVFVGVHYVSDIIVGATLGVMVGYVVVYLEKKLSR